MTLIHSISKSQGDFIVQPYKGSGKGGQKRNKTMSACRITHPASGTVSECEEERSFAQNKKKAFLRLIEKESFKRWHKIEIAKAMGAFDGINEAVDREIKHNTVVETRADSTFKVMLWEMGKGGTSQ